MLDYTGLLSRQARPLRCTLGQTGFAKLGVKVVCLFMVLVYEWILRATNNVPRQCYLDANDRRLVVKEELSKLPAARFEGDIHIVDDAEQLQSFLPKLLAEELLGFDTETRPSFRAGERYRPAILQLACFREVYLFRLHRIGGLPPLLVELLQRSHPPKAGIGLQQDIAGLRRWSPLCFQQGALLDLVPLAQSLGFPRPNLQTLAAQLLGVRVSKKARLSNWERLKLTPSQIAYAAVDAWISRQLALRLLELKSSSEVVRNQNCTSSALQ